MKPSSKPVGTKKDRCLGHTWSSMLLSFDSIEFLGKDPDGQSVIRVSVPTIDFPRVFDEAMEEMGLTEGQIQEVAEKIRTIQMVNWMIGNQYRGSTKDLTR